MNTFLRVAISALYLFTLTACGAASGTNVSVTDTGNIEGTIKDSVTGVPVADVTVQIGTQAGTTGTSGVYSIANLSVGNRTVTAATNGYQTYNGTVTIEKGMTINHNIQLTPVVAATKTTAIVTVNLVGTLPAGSAIVGTDFTLTLPANVTPHLNGTVIDGVTLTGAFVGGTMAAPVYTPSTATSAGTMRITLVNAVSTGVTQVGEVATIAMMLENNASPTAGNFTVSDVSVVDKTGNKISGMGAVVSGLIVQ